MTSSVHKFANNAKLESHINKLVTAGACVNAFQQSYNLYHYSATSKLWSADQSLQQLKSLIATTKPADALSDPVFFKRANKSLDEFFYFSGCALDVLARELLCYCSITPPQRTYFQTAHRLISKTNPSSPLLPRIVIPTWKDEFSNYRNAGTHETLLGLNYSIKVQMNGHASNSVIVIPLPDDPRIAAPLRTFNQNTDAIEYAETTLKRLFTLFNGVYGEVLSMSVAQGRMPINP